MADLRTLEKRLAEAEQAEHDLLSGQQVAEVWRDGRRITYRATEIDKLQDYIARLKNELSAANGTPVVDPMLRRTNYTPRFG